VEEARMVHEEDYQKLSMHQKLLLFQDTYHTIYSEKPSMISTRYLYFKKSDITLIALEMIRYIQGRAPFMPYETFNEMRARLESVEKRQGNNEKTFKKYHLISSCGIRLSETKSSDCKNEDRSFWPLERWRRDEELYRWILEDLLAVIRKKELNDDVERALYFAVQFYLLHMNQQVPQVLKESMERELRDEPLNDNQRKIVHSYFQVTKWEKKRMEWYQAANQLFGGIFSFEFSQNFPEEDGSRGRNKRKLKEYYHQFYQNFEVAYKKRYDSKNQFIAAFMDKWDWIDDRQVERLLNKEYQFKLVDIFVFQELGIPYWELFVRDKDMGPEMNRMSSIVHQLLNSRQDFNKSQVRDLLEVFIAFLIRIRSENNVQISNKQLDKAIEKFERTFHE
jgi:hypothetical protein